MYLPEDKAHFKNLPHVLASNSDCGSRFKDLGMAGMRLVYQLLFFFESNLDSLDFSRAALFFVITFFLAALSTLVNTAFKFASVGLRRILATTSLTEFFTRRLVCVRFLSDRNFLIAPTVTGIPAI